MFDKIKEAFEIAFSNPEIEISETSTMNDITDWDSLNHLALVIELEKQFSVKFKPNEMVKLDSVPVIINVLKDKGIH